MIRDANQFDVPAILDMLRQYRNQTPLAFLNEADDADYITQVLADIMAGRGLLLVSETDKINGMLMAGISPSAWSPKHLVMTEMAYWVNPEARGGTAGHRLLKEYVVRGTELKKQGRIAAFFVSKMANSPDLKYGRFGFTKLEEFWVI
jgi:N-acetylglutamate synthase-like GNAT family acetyltransferase